MSLTSNVIITELARVGLEGIFWFTGGGCTAIEIELPQLRIDGHDEPSVIVITNANASVSLDDEEIEYFHGWLACHYADQEGVLCGDVLAYVHGSEALWDGADLPVIDWKTDARAMADGIDAWLKEQL